MEPNQAIDVFTALSQATRLDAFRLIMAHEPEGLPAGAIARQLDIPQNTMSAHLAILTRAGLIGAERQGRSIVYRAGLTHLGGVVEFLLQDCCGGQAGLCAPTGRKRARAAG